MAPCKFPPRRIPSAFSTEPVNSNERMQRKVCMIVNKIPLHFCSFDSFSGPKYQAFFARVRFRELEIGVRDLQTGFDPETQSY